MLTPEEQHEIQEELRQCPRKQAVVPEALKIIQRHRRWVSDDAVRDLAAFLGLTAEEVDSVATFYALIYRKPVGRHVILLCDSVSCYVTGFDNIRDHLVERLGVPVGGTTGDGLFTLLPAACLGHCEKAPVMMIDEEVYGDLTAEKVDEILGQYRVQAAEPR